MDRRSFLRGLSMVVAGVAINQAIPLGRVWSFPSKIVLTSADTIALQLEKVREQIRLLYASVDPPGFLKGIPYYYADASSATWMGLQRTASRNFRIPLRIGE